ncbi:MAG: M28 family metallopeptidase, partial [Actinomycetota bacterium]
DQAVIGANILGELEGEKSDEMIIFTANYDGLGKDVDTGNIYPGADYNASGVSSVMELARILSSQGSKPAKTLVFALLGAEECGGFGSQALAEALETEDLKDSVHIINLEGLGAGEGDYMDIWDLKYSKNLPVVDAVEEAAGILDVIVELGGADPGTSASTFFLYHIPAVTCDWSWFERDEHPDFHLPSDVTERINQTGLLRVTQVAAVAAWLMAS